MTDDGQGHAGGRPAGPSAVGGAGVESGPARRIAAIDVGSNSIRLIVAQANPDGSYRVIDDEKEVTRLGSGLAGTGRLEPARIEHSVSAIERLLGIAAGYDVERMRSVATAAVREAENGADFVRAVRQRCGIEVSVISAEEEARLAHRSVDHAYELEHQPAVIVDIGGGSTEVVLSVAGVIEQVHTLKLGAVRLTEMFGPAADPEGEQFRKLRQFVRDTVKTELPKPWFTPLVMYGTGGTFSTLGAMSMYRRSPGSGGDLLPFAVRGHEMQRHEVKHLLDLLRKLPVEERSRVPGCPADRAEIVVAGIVVAERLLRRFDLNTLRVHDGGIRDGLLLTIIDELFDRRYPRERRPIDKIRAARAFAEKCHYETRHSEHVSRLALLVYDQLAEQRPRHPVFADRGTRELLEAAAVLHDVGYLINYSRHHKHSYHLIVHSDMRGFSHRELEIVANVARYHRRSSPKKKHPGFAKLAEPDRELVRALAGILRVADGLDRTHTQSVTSVRVQVVDREARFAVVADRQPSVNTWGAERKSGLFAEVFDLQPVFRWTDPAASAGVPVIEAPGGVSIDRPL